MPWPAAVPLPDQSGERIGPYKLLQQIGEGGCGVVYMAEQERPIRRRVALKVIKLGMDTRQVIARFEAERQALALMDHPNIAKVLDAGATESGRPFFVMELVAGEKLTDYCDRRNLVVSERLESEQFPGGGKQPDGGAAIEQNGRRVKGLISKLDEPGGLAVR
jgi:serine/threonine protein kinase